MAQNSSFQFIIGLPKPGSAPNQSAIFQAHSSEARSHAARVTHSRLRAKDLHHCQVYRNTNAARHRSKENSHARVIVQQRSESENNEDPDALAADPCLTLKFITTTQLDPFVHLALDLDKCDKNLIQKCKRLKARGGGLLT